MKKILVVDDELGSRESFREIFRDFYEVITVENAIEALGILSKQRPDLIVLDLVMPGVDGFTFLREIREIYPDIPVIMISASSADKASKEAIDLGAIGFVSKPFDIHELRHLIEQSMVASEAPIQREILEKETSREFPLHNMVGQSASFRKTIEDARKASRTDSQVLLMGERGTGKEFFARQIHSWSRHCHEPFVPVFCANTSSTFVNTEIFGVSAQGKDARGPHGVFDLVNKGSIFFDEIDKLPTETQILLGDVIENKEFFRIGSTKSVPTTARILAAVDSSSEAMLKSDALATELVKRFDAHVITIPPLRERSEDIPVLAYHFLNQLRPTMDASTLDIEPEAMQKLREYSWPGNIRELRNVIERMLVLYGREKCLTASSLPKEFGNSDQAISMAKSGVNFEETVNVFERQLIIEALGRSNGIVKSAAQILHTTPRILQYRIDKLKIKKMAQ